ncbi:MAG: hypothetical protein LBD72_00355 [Puniceicoccales bacterium]|jgi:hypothetical protein|nr:hypothetical protein [Puniceicoccales bacterium]
METIYFDENKGAHGHPINSCMATINSKLLDIYCDKKCGVYWDVANGEFVQLITQEQIKIEEAKSRKLNERDRAFDEVDWRVQRLNDLEKIGCTPTDKGIALAYYRQHLRDFTHLDNWWTLPIPDHEQFLKENP